jgi:HD superfamily phosphohydrolase
MKIYYDPIYGPVELEDFILDVIQKCPELKRQKYIGLMNFKSICMLPLTSVSRLEHTIGLSYLTQIFSNANNLLPQFEKDLIIAALYHDVNCGSFGHSVEWAIDRHTPFDHEKVTSWLSSLDIHPYFKNLPLFIEMPGLHRYDFGNSYQPDFNKIFQIIRGANTFIINSKGIDLDNIDNVFRMAHYLGSTHDDKTIPITLVNNLRLVDGFDNFVIHKKYLDLVKIWHNYRAEVYRKFIYSQEYMGFEFLIFQLIYEFSKLVDKEAVTNLFHFTDEYLLWQLSDKNKYPASLTRIAQKLLIHDIPYAHAIIRSDNFEKKEALSNEEVLKSLSLEITNYLHDKKKAATVAPGEIYFHLTTDHRKTHRKVDIYVEDNDTVLKKSFGEDKSYIVMCMLSKYPLSSEIISLITDKAIEILTRENYGLFVRVPFTEQESLLPSRLF